MRYSNAMLLATALLSGESLADDVTWSPPPTPLPTTTAVTSFTRLQSANSDGAQLDVTSNITFTTEITIVGTVMITSSTGATLSGGGSTRLFYVTSGSTLYLSSLTLDNGAMSTSSCDDTTCVGGLAYLTYGRLSMNSIVMSSSTAYRGGAVYAQYSNLTMEDCTFTSNSASSGGGGVYMRNSRATIHRSTFTSNYAAVNSGGNGGGIFADQVCHMRLTSSTFTSNGAGYVSVAPY